MVKKSSNMGPGIVWVPYTIENLTLVIVSDSDFAPSQTLSSRYSKAFAKSTNQKRKDKIEKILNEKTLD